MRAKAVALAVALTLSGCGGAEFLGLEGNPSCIADYPYYASVPDLVRVSDVIVVAVPGKQEERHLDVGGGEKEDYRVWPLTVQQVLRGVVPTDETLAVKQMGCTDEPHLEQGKPYLLFLGTFPDFPDIPASMVNPEQGQYRLDAGGEPRARSGNELRPGMAEVERLARSTPLR